MIKSFRNVATEAFFNGKSQERFYAFERPAYRKLKYLNAAFALDDLRVPPGNRLEALHGNCEGQYSIRINDQYRICFAWRDGAACATSFGDAVESRSILLFVSRSFSPPNHKLHPPTFNLQPFNFN